MSDGPVGSCHRGARGHSRAGMLALVVLVLVALAGCSTAARTVRLDIGQGTPLVHIPRGGDEPVELKKDEFERALGELARDVRPSSRPLAHARRLMQGAPWQEEVDLEWTGRWLVPAAEETRASRPDQAPDEMTRAYGRWCERKRRLGDCLSLLKGGPSLDADGRYTLAFAIAVDSVWEETRLALGEMVEEQAVVATLYSAAAMYLMLWAVPEPVSKGLAAGLTVGLMAYLGVDTVWGLMRGWVRLVREVDRATTFAELREAGERYGKVMGSNSARVLMMLTTAAIGNTAGLVMKGPGLPGATRAAVLAEARGGFRWAAVGEVRAVAVSAEGTFTLTLAPGAVAMSARSSSGDRAGSTGASAGSETNSTTTRQHGGTTYRFNTGHAFNRAHKTGTDLRKTSLTPEDVENAIMAHLRTYRASGGKLPVAGGGAIPTPYMGKVTVGTYAVEFSAVQDSSGTVFVGTYYLIP